MYWYRPYPSYPESRIARNVLAPGDSLTIHSLSSHRGVPLRGSPVHYEALRELPEVAAVSSNSLKWISSRMGAYTKRARLRGRAVSAGRYDICHVFALNYFTDAWALRRLAIHQPLVSTVHDVVPHEPRVPPRVERQLLAAVYRSAGTIVVAHDVLRRALIDQFGVPSERIEVIPLPVEEIVDVHSGEPPTPLTVLFFGHFRHNKGVRQMLKAIRRISLTDVRFVFAGRGVGSLEEEVRRAADGDRRISAEIGFVPGAKLSGYFASAHLVVLPYTSFASQSGVLGNAYAHLVPVVATDVGALGETLRADSSGWVVPPGDAESLANALSAALEDPQGRQDAREAMHSARSGRSYELVGRAHRRLYARLVG